MTYEELVTKQRDLLAEAEKYLNDFSKFLEIMNEYNRVAADYLERQK